MISTAHDARRRRSRRVAAAVATTAALLCGSAAIASTAGAADGEHEPLSCSPGKAVLVLGSAGGTQVNFGTFGAGSLVFDPVGTPTHNFNSTGYNSLDGYLYAVEVIDGERLYQIGDDGSVVDLGALSTPIGNTVSGAFDDAGNFWVFPAVNGTVGYEIDVTTRQVTTVETDAHPMFSDITFADGYIWALSNTTDASQTVQLVRIDPATGAVVLVPLSGMPDWGDRLTAGGAFTFGNGDLGFYSQTLQMLLRVQVADPTSATPTASVLSTQAAGSGQGGDATACSTSHTDLSVTVDAPAGVAPNTPIDYTLTVTNNGPDPSSGWSLTSDLPAGTTGAHTDTPGCSIAAGTLTCTGGGLVSGGTAIVVLTVTAPASGTVVGVATVTANDLDANAANDSDDATTEVAPDDGIPMIDAGVGAIIGGGALGLAAVVGGAGLVISRRRTATR